jgi:hypothetical protein
MAELEHRLRGLELDWPPEPDVVPAIRPRLRARPGRNRRRSALVAVAVLVVTIAAVLAVPSARTAILRWLSLGGVRIVRVERLPTTRRLAASDLGLKTTLAGAVRAARFEPLGFARTRPDSIYVQTSGPTTRVTLVYGSVAKPHLLLSEFRGIRATIEVGKLVTGATKIEQVEVGGAQGIFLSGAPHAVYFELPGSPSTYVDEPLAAGNTLIWERGGITLRLEGRLTKGDALGLASSVH